MSEEAVSNPEGPTTEPSSVEGASKQEPQGGGSQNQSSLLTQESPTPQLVDDRSDGGGGDQSQPDSQPSEGVKIPENWKEALAEDFRKDPNVQKFQSVEDLAKSYVHLQKQIGKDRIPIPGKHATDDEWNEIYEKLGWSQKFDNYEVDLPEDKLADGQATELKKLFHEARIPASQAKKVVDGYLQMQEKMQETQNEEYQQVVDQEISKLKQEWHSAFDAKLERAKTALKQVDTALDGQVYTWINETGLGNDPRFIKIMNYFGEMLSDDKVLDQEPGSQGMTRKDVESKIQEIEGDVNGPLYDKSHPNHQKVLDERSKLYEMLYQD